MTSKEQKIKDFNPNEIGDANANLFGLPFNTDEADVVIIPVPWEVTVSYGGGTANGPDAVFDASFQVDLFDPFVKDAWKNGIAMDEMNPAIKEKSELLRLKAEHYIDLYAKGESSETNSEMKQIQSEVNAGSHWLNTTVKERVTHFLKKNKIVGLLGGDHSTPFGMMQALAEHFGTYGILQIDAHADLRDAYEGFEFSHASIMFNALKIPQVEKLVQVGIRDYCEAEFNITQNPDGRVKTFFDRDIKHEMYRGAQWENICEKIIRELPDKIYLSFDIDGLDPKLCPNTGTPVAGGFETEQVLFLLEKIVHSGKRIIAFDINEIAPGEDEWDANVGARMLYRISNIVHASNK
ncbi:MAG: agmatinase family protein [Bacteroidota bacterium]|jgi:agmatinase